MSEPVSLIAALQTDDAVDPWAALLAQAGADWLRAGLAHGEYLDGLHVDAEVPAAEARQLAADTQASWPRRYAHDRWTLLADQHPDGGLFLRLQGPTPGTLLLPSGELNIEDAWQRAALTVLPESVSLRLPDGTIITLSRR